LAHILILYRLKPDVTRAAFEHWLTTSSLPTLQGVRRIKEIGVYRCSRRLMDEGNPSIDYAELFDISDLAGFVSEDLASDALRQDMGQFGGFADRPEYLLMEQVS
jgi:hypothetical protein